MSVEFLARMSAEFGAMELRARERFGALSLEQMNWCPREGSWSIGQCLDHLVTANEPYFPILAAVASGKNPATIWQRVPILPGLWGAALLNTVRPETKRKSKAPRIFQPSSSQVPLAVLETFCAQQRRLIGATKSLEGVDLRGTIIISPVASYITYSVWHTLSILAAHEERHMRQAERVLSALGERDVSA